jgi:hypothetical protein
MTGHALKAVSSQLLRRNFRGYFTAHAHGLLAREFILVDQDRKEFGRLRLGGTHEVKFVSKDHVATLEASGRGYQMVLNSEEVLAVGKGGSGNELELSCGNRTYRAQASLLRNLAVASRAGAEKVVSLSGGLVGRSYRVLFDEEDTCTFSVAILLLCMSRRIGVARTG